MADTWCWQSAQLDTILAGGVSHCLSHFPPSWYTVYWFDLTDQFPHHINIYWLPHVSRSLLFKVNKFLINRRTAVLFCHCTLFLTLTQPALSSYICVELSDVNTCLSLLKWTWHEDYLFRTSLWTTHTIDVTILTIWHRLSHIWLVQTLDGMWIIWRSSAGWLVSLGLIIVGSLEPCCGW